VIKGARWLSESKEPSDSCNDYPFMLNCMGGTGPHSSTLADLFLLSVRISCHEANKWPSCCAQPTMSLESPPSHLSSVLTFLDMMIFKFYVDISVSYLNCSC
jgi:hypothetical protein